MQALELRLKKSGASPLTSLHISWEVNFRTNIPSRLFDSNPSCFCENYTDLLSLFNIKPPFPKQAYWNVLSPSRAVSMKVISVLQMKHFEMGWWLQIKKAGKHVGKFVFLFQTFGVEPWLQDATYQQQARCLTGFTGCVCSGRYGRGKRVAIGKVSGALLDAGKAVALTYEGNPIKAQGNKYLLPRMAQTMEECRKEDPNTKNKFSVEIDVPNVLVELWMAKDATEVVTAVGDYNLFDLLTCILSIERSSLRVELISS